MKEELIKRVVKTPDGQEIEINPLADYFCQAGPTVQPPAYTAVIEKFFNWARSESLWILGFGTGCGAIGLPQLATIGRVRCRKEQHTTDRREPLRIR